MYKQLIEKQKPQLEQALEHLKTELAGIRTGRAHPGLVEQVMVESYGTKSPLKNLASINVTDAKTLTIQPWDKGVIGEVAKALTAANLGMTPVNDGISIRLNIPPLNEERRKEMVKVIKQQAENSRIRIRNIREDIWKEVARLAKEKQVSEDEKFEAQEELKKIVESSNEQIKELTEKKENEVMTV